MAVYHTLHSFLRRLNTGDFVAAQVATEAPHRHLNPRKRTISKTHNTWTPMYQHKKCTHTNPRIRTHTHKHTQTNTNAYTFLLLFPFNTANIRNVRNSLSFYSCWNFVEIFVAMKKELCKRGDFIYLFIASFWLMFSP